MDFNQRYFRLQRSKKPEEVLRAYDYRCGYCGRTNAEAGHPDRRLSLDHIHPISKGGSDEIDNLIPACVSCNGTKGNKSIAEARQGLLLSKIGWPRFTAAQIEWLRAKGFDLSPLDNARLAFEESERELPILKLVGSDPS